MGQSRLEKIVKLKKSVWQKYKYVKSEENFQNYKRIRNKIVSENRKYRHQFENKIANEVKSNPKSFWSYIKNNTRPRQPIKSLINDQGKFTNSDYSCVFATIEYSSESLCASVCVCFCTKLIQEPEI